MPSRSSRSGQAGAAPADDGRWWSVAACRDADPDLFFPVSAVGKSLQQVAEAKAICAGCPVLADCLAFAMRTRQEHGVWGGMTEEERHQAATGECHPNQMGSSSPGSGPGRAVMTLPAMAPPTLDVLRESVERASCLPSGPGWERKATAHAQIFRLLARAAPDPVAAGALNGTARLARDLMVIVGPAANGMIVSSRWRLLAHLRAGDADGAALEMESHLRVLHFMWRLARGSELSRADDLASDQP